MINSIDQEADNEFKELEERDAQFKASFSGLPEVLRRVTNESNLVLYEGLPHQHFHTKEMVSELIGKKCQHRKGYYFYKRPNEVASEDILRLRKIVNESESFQVWGGPKGCGGFHPDFSLVWEDRDDTVEFHICFGCHECEVFFQDKRVYCELADASYLKLKRTLEKYHQQIPDLG